MAPDLIPLDASRMLTAWTPQPAVILGCLLLAGLYLGGAARVRRAGGHWPVARTVSHLGGVVALGVVGLSFLAVYDDTLFWTRAVQGVVLLLVAPLLLAAAAPLTLAQRTLPTAVRARLGRIRRSRAARALTLPPVVTLLLIAPPFVLYLTGLYDLVLRSTVVSGVVSLALLGAGFVYVASRLQIDPMPRRTHHGLTLAIGVAEVIADGVLGLVLWLGPLIAAGHYLALDRLWGPSPRIDQVIGAGVWWIGGDLAGLPFLAAVLARFQREDARQARRIDAELDAAEHASTDQDRRQPPGDEALTQTDGPSPSGVSAPAARPRLWWEDDPQLAQRFHRRG